MPAASLKKKQGAPRRSRAVLLARGATRGGASLRKCSVLGIGERAPCLRRELPEQAMLDLIAGLKAQAGRLAAGKFEAGNRVALRTNNGLGKRLGSGFDAVHGAVLANEHHVER